MTDPKDGGAPGTEKRPWFDHGSTFVDSSLRRQPGDHGVGARHRKIDGGEKALGRTRFADDYALPGMLCCKLKRSTRAHARIVRIDVEAARRLPGVLAIITGPDLPTRYGIIPWTQDETALAVGKVRYVGDAVAAVAAIDEETANAAVRAIRVEYEDLVAVLDVETARRTGDQPESKVNEHAKHGNITKKVELSFGPVDENIAACRQSGVVVEDDFFYVGTTHAAIEPHCALAWVEQRPAAASDDVGLVTVVSATQVPHYLHRDLAHVLGIPESSVRVVQPPVGGAFGGKSEPFTLEFVVAKLAMITGRPVKCLYTREEVFLAHRGRHPMRMHYVTAADRDGKLKAVKANIDIDGGAYASFGMITAFYAGQILTGPVAFDAYAFDATRYYTNKPACGPKRGHGSVQPRFAFECHLDMVAERLKLDPIELRRKNFAGEHVTLVNGQRLGSSGLLQCLDAVEKASGWKERRGKLAGAGTRRRGLGVASSMYISGTNYPIYPNEMPQSGVQVKLDRSGRVTMFSGASDIGQGSDSVLMTIACEELGVRPEHVRVVSSDTDLTPVDLGAYSSRVTLMMGHAALEACRRLREQVQDAVARSWGCAADDVLLGHGKVWLKSDTTRSLSCAEAFKLAEARLGTLGATGGYRTHPRGGDYRGGTIGASPAYSATAHIAEVEVDTETGQIEVLKVWVAHDCGTALNPLLVEGQIEGSTYMGAAEVFLENMLYGADAIGVPAASAARRGPLLVGPSLLDYRIPTTLDTPAIHAAIVERPDGNGPYGAKEAGEGPLHSTIPAVVNAVYDAIGVRFFELPLSPARVLAGLRAKGATSDGAAPRNTKAAE